MPILKRPYLLTAVASLFLLGADAPAKELDTLKKNTEKWIEVRQRLSEEQADWNIEKQILGNGIETLSATRDALADDAVAFRNQRQEVENAAQAANERLQSFQKTDELLLSQLTEYESRILKLEPRLPDPLADKVAQLIAKIPASGAPSDFPLPNRLQNVVAIMTIVDEFNNDLHRANTIKELEDGEVIDVRILYWGLAVGYAINGAGTRAWEISPGPDGWEWKTIDQDALTIKQLFEVYDKTQDPALVGVPIKLDDQEAAQ
ncbi:MAG: DUF3450 family protein [Verrucomicrobiota bacterium]